MINPDDFIISRKGKRYRFALFANSPLCFEIDDWDKTTAVDVLEVGAGTASFSVEIAELYPEQQFVAVDVKADRLQSGAQLAAERRLTNIRFLRARAGQLEELIPARSLKKIWLTFPDPFPKERSVKHRLTHPSFLETYYKLLASDGELYLKHDSRQFFMWSLEQLVTEKWHIDELSFDLHESNLSNEYKIITTYEKRWTDEGLVTNFVRALSPKNW